MQYVIGLIVTAIDAPITQLTLQEHSHLPTLTHLLIDFTVEDKRHVRPMHVNLHQGKFSSFLLWTSVDNLVQDAGRKASTRNLSLKV